jgi:hypothetical protein
VPGLYFAGFVDAPGGLLPVVETQGQWIAAAITGQLHLPPPERMWQAIEQAEPRTRERFPDESPRSVRCDPHAYRRLLHADLRRARRTTLMRNSRLFRIANAVSLWRSSRARANSRYHLIVCERRVPGTLSCSACVTIGEAWSTASRSANVPLVM